MVHRNDFSHSHGRYPLRPPQPLQSSIPP